MKELEKECCCKIRTSFDVIASNKQSKFNKNGKPPLIKSNTVYIDKTTLYVHLIKLESSDQENNNKSIRMIYQILDDCIEREMESRKCFNDIKTSISKVIVCFGGKENIPDNSMRLRKYYSSLLHVMR